MIPAPDSTTGNLPPGVHLATWAEFNDRFGTSHHRRTQIRGLRQALDQLRAAGCRRVFIDGSFVTTKEHPNDYDACWEMEGVDLARVDSVFHANPIRRLVQKARFEGEWFGVAQVNVPDSPLAETLRYFQTDRDGNPKGIVALDLA